MRRFDYRAWVAQWIDLAWLALVLSLLIGSCLTIYLESLVSPVKRKGVPRFVVDLTGGVNRRFSRSGLLAWTMIQAMV